MSRTILAKAVLLGIEIGGSKLQLVTGTGQGAIFQRQKLAINATQGAQRIRSAIQETLPKLLSTEPVQAIGVGFGGPVDWQTGRICRSHHVEGWSEFDLAGWLRELTHLPVRVDNDANVAALGEAQCGAGKGYNPVFYVTLGSGVGGGLVLNEAIYHGAKPGEAEIGHVRLNRQGTILESRCSGWAVDRRLREFKQQNPTSSLARSLGETVGGEARHLSAALARGDTDAQRLLGETTQDLAFGLSHVVHLFHPEVLVLGGGLSNLGEPLRAGVAQAMRNYIMDAFAPGPRVALAGLGEDAVPVGALLLAAGESLPRTAQ